MHIEQLKPAVFRITMHTYELATLISAARYVLEGTGGELTQEARQQLEQVVKHFDEEIRRLNTRKE